MNDPRTFWIVAAVGTVVVCCAAYTSYLIMCGR
jgi:hypothetical protein